MIDFHSHILPGVDDGPRTISESLAMLRESYRQGVDTMVSTSHFYADEEDPVQFLKRRNASYQQLREAMMSSAENLPEVILGAEVLYFPGISQADAVAQLVIDGGNSILIEPPMSPWSNSMLDEIAELGENFHCRPVVAHVDRFMLYLKDNHLIDRVLERGLLVQVNGAYFLNWKTSRAANRNLKNGKIHLIGSDCHNMTSRCQNLGAVYRKLKASRLESELYTLEINAETLLFP